MGTSVEESFRKSVRDHLSELDGQLVAALRKLVEYQYPPEVFALDIEIFSDTFTSQFPARAFFLDRENCEFFLYENGVAKYPSPIDPAILDIDCIYPDEMEEEFVSLDQKLDPWSAATSEFISWFASCWEKAGGATFPMAATITHHDSGREFNLLSGQWQQRHAAFTP